MFTDVVSNADVGKTTAWRYIRLMFYSSVDLQFIVLMAIELQPPNTANAQSVLPDGRPFVQSLEAATGMSLETFYETFMKVDDQACLDLSSAWP